MTLATPLVSSAVTTGTESTSWLGWDWWVKPVSRRAIRAARRSLLEGMAKAAVARSAWQRRAAANMAVCKGDQGKVDSSRLLDWDV